MENAADLATSLTLLEKLRVYEDRDAWNRFMRLYLPVIKAWGKRAGLPHDEVEELTSRLLEKLVKAIPRFQYDPTRGTFRSWLKTIANNEVANIARERPRLLADDAIAASSTISNLLLENSDELDELVDGLHDRSLNLLNVINDSMNDIRDGSHGDEKRSWDVFHRCVLLNQPIGPVALEFGLSYHAAAMRAQRIKKRLRVRAIQLAVERGLIDVDGGKK